MERKINFTQEHNSRLQALFLELGFLGKTLTGKFGANLYNTWDLLHNTSIVTLQSINKNLKNEVKTLEEQDEWSFNSHQMAKATELKKWNEYINLLVGYKIFKNQQENEALEIKKAKQLKLALLTKAKEAKEIEKINNMSEEELNAEIEKNS